MASTINAKTTGVGGIDATGDASGVLALQTGGTTAVTIGASQNVGIGRTPTGFKLEIQSGLCCYTTSVQTIFRSHPSDGNGELGTLTAHAQTFITNSAERMRIDASGNVGIGTSSPSARLNVIVGDGASATNQVTISGGRSLGAGVFGSAGSILFSNSYWGAGYGVASICGMDSGTSGGYLGFSTTTNGSGTTGTPTERMRIDSSGNLLKGVTSAYSTAYGTGEISFATSSAGMVFKCAGASGAGVPTVQVFLNAAGTAVGYIAVGASVTNFTNLSDYRLKKDVTQINNALDKVSRIKPVSFIWKESGEVGESFIAHELQKECPIAVVGNKDDVNGDGSIRPQGVDVSKLIPLLTAAIQELKAIIDTQQEQINSLLGN